MPLSKKPINTHGEEINRKRPIIYSLFYIIALMMFIAVAVIPSVIKVIDNIRFNQDVMAAKRMTEALQPYRDDLFRTTLDAHDVRTELERAGFNRSIFTPSSHETGFFFDNNTVEVKALRFDTLTVRAVFDEIIDPRLGTFDVPETVFGNTRVLISLGDGILNEAIRTVRSFNVEQIGVERYDEMLGRITRCQEGFLSELYGTRGCYPEKQAAITVMNTFHPNQTIWIGDDSWTTEATTGTDIDKVLFDISLSHIPSYPLSNQLFTYENPIRLTHIVLPRTVKSVSHHAFPSTDMDIGKLVIRATEDLYVNEDAFSAIGVVERDIAFFKRHNLIDFSGFMDFQIDSEGITTYKITDHVEDFVDNGINGYETFYEGNLLLVDLFSSGFHIGFATNAVVIEYYLKQSDPYPYHIFIAIDGMVSFTFGSRIHCRRLHGMVFRVG